VDNGAALSTKSPAVDRHPVERHPVERHPVDR